MELVIHEALLQSLARAIEGTRPELFGAHTKRYKKKIPHPWNANKSLAPIQLKALKAEVDYDARGSKTTFRIGTDALTLTLQLDAAVARWSSSSEAEARFTQSAELTALFGDVEEGRYPLLISEAVFKQLEPPGIRSLLSWIIANAIGRSLDGLGIPETVTLAPKALIRLKKPVLKTGVIHLVATLEVS